MKNYFKKIIKLLNKKEKIIFSLISIGLIFTSLIELIGLGLIIPIVYTITSDSFYLEALNYLQSINFNFSSKQSFIKFTLFLFFFVFLSKNILLGIFFWFEGKFIHSVTEKISVKVFRNFLSRDYKFHISENSAKMMSLINNDMIYIKIFFNSLLTLVSELVIFFGLTIILILFSFEIFIRVFPFLILILLIFYFLVNKTIKNIGNKRKIIDILKTKKIQESIGGIKEIILFQKEKYFSDLFEKYIFKRIEILYKYHFFSKLPRIYFETFMILGIATFSIIFLLTNDDLNEFLTTISVFVAFTLRLLPSTNRIINCINHFKYSEPAVNSMYNELKKKNVIKKFSVNKFESIEFKNISFLFQKHDFNLKFNLKINKGDKIAVIGESGSGKTTFLNLIMGLLQPVNGEIYLNKQKVKNSNFMNLFSLVPQSVYVFDDTILENITLGNYSEINDSKILKDSLFYSRCAKFVNNFPKKTFFKVGENGSKLSGGQKQRIGIARAIYKNSPILILDEITSSLDNLNSNKIIDQILNIPKKTVIISTHKQELAKKCNIILNISSGKIIKKI